MSTAVPDRSAVLCQTELASRLSSATRDVSFLLQGVGVYVRDLSNVTLSYLGSWQKGRISLLKLTFSTRLTSLLVR